MPEAMGQNVAGRSRVTHRDGSAAENRGWQMTESHELVGHLKRQVQGRDAGMPLAVLPTRT